MIISLIDTEKGRQAYFNGNTYRIKFLIKAIPGNDWDRKKRVWTIPIESIEDAKRIIPTIDIAPEVLELYKEVKERNSKAVESKSARVKKIATQVKGLRGSLFGYQAKGKAFLNATGEGEGGVLAFDMGLGRQ